MENPDKPLSPSVDASDARGSAVNELPMRVAMQLGKTEVLLEMALDALEVIAEETISPRRNWDCIAAIVERREYLKKRMMEIRDEAALQSRVPLKEDAQGPQAIQK